VNRLGRSYVTQGDRKIRDLPLVPPCHCSAAETPAGSRIFHSTSPGLASSPIGRSGPHTANQNGGDLYPYDDETSHSGDMWQIISDFFYIFNVFLCKYTLYKEMPENKKIARMLIEEYILL
jgi:hypothetical protein